MERVEEYTWNQRMHAIYRHEFLGQREWDVVEINTRAWYTPNYIAFCNPSNKLVESLSDQTPPVGVQGDFDRGMIENSRGPFNRVYLCHQCTVDSASCVEELVTTSHL